MGINLVCICGKQLNARDDAAGKRVRCPYCDKVLQVPIPIMETSDFAITALPNHFEPDARPIEVDAVGALHSPAEPHHSEPRQYKVLTKKDQWFAGSFHPNDLEEALNSYAMQGWTLHSIFTTRLPDAEADEVVIVLER